MTHCPKPHTDGNQNVTYFWQRVEQFVEKCEIFIEPLRAFRQAEWGARGRGKIDFRIWGEMIGIWGRECK